MKLGKILKEITIEKTIKEKDQLKIGKIYRIFYENKWIECIFEESVISDGDMLYHFSFDNGLGGLNFWDDINDIQKYMDKGFIRQI